MKNQNNQKLIWWKDKKLLLGWLFVIVSLILGLYGKGLLGVFFAKLVQEIYEPFWLVTGISVYVLSWLTLFLGIFFIGWEAVKIMKQRIHNQVKSGVKTTYRYTKDLPRKGYQYTRQLHRKLTKRQ